jgi:phosphoribosyl 1,2-cyclic phosphate phosphodiesterase
MDEIIEIKEKYNINKVVMTHIEEDWGKSYDDYLILKEQYEDLEFAYDGLVIDT